MESILCTGHVVDLCIDPEEVGIRSPNAVTEVCILLIAVCCIFSGVRELM